MYPPRPSAAAYADATRVAALLAQRPPWSDRGHPDQLLVHVAPYVSELLLHAAGQDLHTAAAQVSHRFATATILTVRATSTVDAATTAVRLLQHARPAESRIVEVALRLSAAANSAGWRAISHGALHLDTALDAALAAVGTHLRDGMDPEGPLYLLLEAMASLDLAARSWRHQCQALATGLTTGPPGRDAPDPAADPRTLFPSLRLAVLNGRQEPA